jgi:hypothetical protein
MSLARVLVLVLEVYAALGLVFALPFAWRLVERLDPAARGAPLGFRLLIVPGSAALWPWLALRLARAGRGTRL